MSNTVVTNDTQDVNDVLASIRKLVSQEAQARSEEALQLTPAQKIDETLMLTPEHKVVKDATHDRLVLETPAQTQVQTPVVAEVEEEPAAPFQDEVALRALVSEMIREELQGELGNRITRNVRKLVRQEVQNALKARGS